MRPGWCVKCVFLLLLINIWYAGTSGALCTKKAKFLASLNMARESILKVKELFPNCTDHQGNSSRPGCGTREKSFGYLDVAANLISYSLKMYPACLDDIEEKKPDDKKPEERNKTLKYEKPMDCSQVQENGYTASGVYSIWLRNDNSTKRRVEVYCDMDTTGGGWTVIQRRGDFPVLEDFYRDWATYKRGFGNITKDFWIGNDDLFSLTNQRKYWIRFDLQDADGAKGFALYNSFRIENEASKYALHISGYSGNVGDSMGYHNNLPFSTKDRRNDNRNPPSKISCSRADKGGWWYKDCYYANLNAVYRSGAKGDWSTVNWRTWRKEDCLEAVEIKLKPM